MGLDGDTVGLISLQQLWVPEHGVQSHIAHKKCHDIHQTRENTLCYRDPRVDSSCTCMLSRSVMSDSLRLHGLQPARHLCPRNFPGKNTGVGCYFLLQGIFLTQGSNTHLLCLLHWQVNSLPLLHLGSPDSSYTLKITHVQGQWVKEKKKTLHPTFIHNHLLLDQAWCSQTGREFFLPEEAFWFPHVQRLLARPQSVILLESACFLE